MDEVLAEAERAGKGSGPDQDIGREIVAVKVVGDDTNVAEKVDIVTGKISDMVIDESVDVDGSAGDKPDFIVVAEGKTTKKCMEGGSPVVDENPVIPEEPESGGLRDIVDLDDEPEGGETPMSEKLVRRRTRQTSMLNEVDEPTSARGPEAEEKRLADERKRKGKHAAQALPKKPRKPDATEPTEEATPKAIMVHFAKGLAGPAADSKSEDFESAEQEEEPDFERAEVWITKKLLEAMAMFDNPKSAQTYKERSATGKLAKSGKRYDSESLQEGINQSEEGHR